MEVALSAPDQSGGAPGPVLPLEVILLVIEAVLPTGTKAIFPASHIVTKTLLSLAVVSRATHKPSVELLRQRCMFLDSDRRLADTLLCIPRLVPSLAPVLSLRHLTSLYLRPFKASLDELATALWVRELFHEVCETLRRLVVEMPFNSLDPLDDHLDVRKTLRQGFEQLHRLEEFVCVGDYPALSMADANTDIWRLWPELRRLVLFRVPMNSHWLWWDIATLSKLERVILADPKYPSTVNIKDEYFHKLPRDDARLRRKIRVGIMATVYTEHRLATSGWAAIDPEEWMTIEMQSVPVPFYGDETHEQLITDWVRREALKGDLWDLEGFPIKATT